MILRLLGFLWVTSLLTGSLQHLKYHVFICFYLCCIKDTTEGLYMLYIRGRHRSYRVFSFSWTLVPSIECYRNTNSCLAISVSNVDKKFKRYLYVCLGLSGQGADTLLSWQLATTAPSHHHSRLFSCVSACDNFFLKYDTAKRVSC